MPDPPLNACIHFVRRLQESLAEVVSSAPPGIREFIDFLHRLEGNLLQSEDDPEWLADAMHELHPIYAWLAARREREEAEARAARTKTPEPEGGDDRTSPPTAEKPKVTPDCAADWNHLLMLVDRALRVAGGR
jgi:hypothetical protein